MNCAACIPYYKGCKLQDGFIYIAGSSELSEPAEYEGCPSLICLGEPPEWILRSDIDFIIAHPDVSPNELLSRIAQLYSRYGKWEERLRQVIDCRESIEELGIASEEIFGNPLYCQASGFECVFLRLGDIDSARPDLREWMLDTFGGKRTLPSGEYLPLDAIDALLSDRYYIAAKNDEGPTVYNHPTHPGEVFFINIGPAGAHVARICVFEVYRPLTMRDMSLLCVLAHYIELGLKARNPIGYDDPGAIEFISDQFLSHESVEEVTVRRALADLMWHIDDLYFCMVLESLTGDTSWQTLQTTANYLDLQLRGQFHLIFENRLLYIFNLSSLECDIDSVLRRYSTLFRDSMLRAGSSESFDDFRNLYYYYWQAKTALDVGAIQNPSFWYHRYKDCNMTAIISRISDGFPAQVFAPKGLLALQDYDQDHGTSLVSTLKEYLDSNCNVVETARRTYVSRSTCIYRIKRINEIGRMDLDNPDVRLELNIAFKLAEA